MLSGQRETTQESRQLQTKKKKKNDEPPLKSLNKMLSQTHEKITTIEEMMHKIFKGLFKQRYRDVDRKIRMSCISSLGNWILLYPSLFLQDIYLKYLGRALNDKDWKCITSMLLDENPHIELTDVDATNLVRLLYASAKKAVGDEIVPAADGQQQYYTDVQKLLATFGDATPNKHKWEILTIIKDGISYAFSDAPKHLSFLEVAILPFATKLPISDLLEICAKEIRGGQHK